MNQVASVKGRRRLDGVEIKLRVDIKTNRICPACRGSFAAILQESDAWEQHQREQEEHEEEASHHALPLLHQLYEAVKKREGVFAGERHGHLQFHAYNIENDHLQVSILRVYTHPLNSSSSSSSSPPPPPPS